MHVFSVSGNIIKQQESFGKEKVSQLDLLSFEERSTFNQLMNMHYEESRLKNVTEYTLDR